MIDLGIEKDKQFWQCHALPCPGIMYSLAFSHSPTCGDSWREGAELPGALSGKGSVERLLDSQRLVGSRDGVTKIGGNPGRSQGARAKSSISFRWCCCAFRAGLSWDKRSKDPKTSEKPKSFINRPTIGVNTVNMKLTHPRIQRKHLPMGDFCWLPEGIEGFGEGDAGYPHTPHFQVIPIQSHSDLPPMGDIRASSVLNDFQYFHVFLIIVFRHASIVLSCWRDRVPNFQKNHEKSSAFSIFLASKPPVFWLQNTKNYWTPPFSAFF